MTFCWYYNTTGWFLSNKLLLFSLPHTQDNVNRLDQVLFSLTFTGILFAEQRVLVYRT